MCSSDLNVALCEALDQTETMKRTVKPLVEMWVEDDAEIVTVTPFDESLVCERHRDALQTTAAAGDAS